MVLSVELLVRLSMWKIVFFRPRARNCSTTDTTYVAGLFSSTLIALMTPRDAVYQISLPSICLDSLLVTFCLSRKRCELPVFQMSGETPRPDSSRGLSPSGIP